MIFKVAEAKFWNSSSFHRFSLENFRHFGFRGCLTSATSASSEGAHGIFSKITFSKSVRSNEKDEVCHSFIREIFTKSLHRGGVILFRQLKVSTCVQNQPNKLDFKKDNFQLF